MPSWFDGLDMDTWCLGIQGGSVEQGARARPRERLALFRVFLMWLVEGVMLDLELIGGGIEVNDVEVLVAV